MNRDTLVILLFIALVTGVLVTALLSTIRERRRARRNPPNHNDT